MSVEELISNETLRDIDQHKRIALYDIPSVDRDNITSLINARKLRLKYYDFDIEQKKHISTLYVERV